MNALQRLQAEIDSAPFHQFLRPQVERLEADTGRVVIRLAARPEFARVSGESALHGGVVSALADIAAHAAVAAHVGHAVPTVDLRVDYLRPAAGNWLRAEATPLRCGRTLATVDVRITTDDDRLAAVARASFLTVSPKGTTQRP